MIHHALSRQTKKRKTAEGSDFYLFNCRTMPDVCIDIRILVVEYAPHLFHRICINP